MTRIPSSAPATSAATWPGCTLPPATTSLSASPGIRTCSRPWRPRSRPALPSPRGPSRSRRWWSSSCPGGSWTPRSSRPAVRSPCREARHRHHQPVRPDRQWLRGARPRGFLRRRRQFSQGAPGDLGQGVQHADGRLPGLLGRAHRAGPGGDLLRHRPRRRGPCGRTPHHRPGLTRSASARWSVSCRSPGAQGRPVRRGVPPRGRGRRRRPTPRHGPLWPRSPLAIRSHGAASGPAGAAC